MNYIYGDATQAPFSVDYIQLLRDVIDYAVEHLLSEQERHALGKRELSLRAASDAEIRRVEELAKLTARAMESANVGAEGSHAAQCAEAIVRAAGEQVRLAVEAVRAGLSAELTKLGEAEQAERERSKRALEKLLLDHDLPDTNFSLQLAQVGGARYVGRVATTSALGVDAQLELEIGKDAVAFPAVVRVERFAPGLELHAPEAGGFFRKEIRLKPQKVDKLFVVELAAGDGGAFKLRAGADGTGIGFAFEVSGGDGARRVKAAHFGEKGEGTAYEPPAEDIAKITSLFDEITQGAGEARFLRKRLVEATLDGDAYVAHEEPTVLVERLIEEMAPVVQEIARRSKSNEELVIKRITGDKRREEIFIAKSELVAKLAPLPANLRRLFLPLGLEEAKPSTRPPPPAPHGPSKRPPPIPAAVASGDAPSGPIEAAAVIETSSGDWEIPDAESAHLKAGARTPPAPASKNAMVPPPSKDAPPTPPLKTPPAMPLPKSFK
jgi:hypothetical protein